MQLKVLKPLSGPKGTFRELIDLWVEHGYCTVESVESTYCWANTIGDILLYDFPRLDDQQIPEFRLGLFGNTVSSCSMCFPWIFWARHPKKLEEHRLRGISSVKKDIESIFLGKVENRKQYNNRMKENWGKYVELFSMPVKLWDNYNLNYPYTQDQYLNYVKRSKYGLCLPGYGPKCNREIEYMGLGTVPVLTPGVDITYFDPPVENEHFIRVSEPWELPEMLQCISDIKWKNMSRNCLDWYNRNCSPKGSYDTTLRILDAGGVL